MVAHDFDYEIIFIDDGSTDGSWIEISKIHLKNPKVKGIRFTDNYGKSQGLHAGFELASGAVIFTMDADLQDNPEEIPDLYDMIVKGDFDLVSGWKKVRYDSKLWKNLPSKIFNWAARKTSKIKLHDFNCGLKAYKKEVIKTICIQGEMHRYIPILAKNAGFNKIGEKVVKHQPRRYGQSKFGIERFSNGLLDLITLWFINRFGKSPMHFFGFFGILLFIIGFIATAGIGISKLLHVFYWHIPAVKITDMPWFYIALTGMILGTQLFIAGFIGELMINNLNKEKNYHIKERLVSKKQLR